ncbi:MAG: ABC transporter ATP-binding protein [Rhodovibrionaceae bacterium]
MGRLSLSDLSKRYGDFFALRPSNLDIANGEFVSLLGPSGCGKTTLLRIIAGLVEPTSGNVKVDDVDITSMPPQRRGIGMVFQDYALFPHLTISENIGFGLKEHRYARAAIDSRVAELLELIKLPHIGKRLPVEISGGQQQRVAFARAIAHTPQILLMDEPLGALDLKLREAMQLELRELQRALGITTVYVTHDQSEAMYLSDRIAVINNGQIEQVGTGREIYDRPTSRFVAEFVGQINVIPADLVGEDGDYSVVKCENATLRAVKPRKQLQGEAYVAVRPHTIDIVQRDTQAAAKNSLDGRILSQVFNGNVLHVQVETASAIISVEARPSADPLPDGAPVTLQWKPSDTLVLD